jgi:hypothetical protein
MQIQRFAESWRLAMGQHERRKVPLSLSVCMMDDTAGHWHFVTCPGCGGLRIDEEFAA